MRKIDKSNNSESYEGDSPTDPIEEVKH